MIDHHFVFLIVISFRYRYGKVQSVKLQDGPDDQFIDAVVAFTDIKVASQVYNEDQLLNGSAPLSVAFCDAVGTAQSEPRCPAVSVSDESGGHLDDVEAADSDRSTRSDG